MTVATSTKIIPAIVISSVILITIIAAGFAQVQVERANSELIKKREVKLNLITDSVELRIQDATNMLKIAANDEQIKNVFFASSVTEEFKGLPPGVDAEKRLAARNILAIYPDFETLAFILPNGDIYFVEPYEAQQNLPRLNFAYREWYQGVIADGDAHVGEAIVSTATDHAVVPIAVSVYSNTESSALSGILVGALDMSSLEIQLGQGEIGMNEYILVVDQKGTVVADSREFGISSNVLQSASFIGDINKALTGNSGSSTQVINGVQTVIQYQPIKMRTNNWALISLQPTEDFFFTVNAITLQSFLMIILVLAVSSISGYFLYSTFHKNNTLTRRMERLNEDLKQVDKEKEEFSAMITHELKTPLVPIIGYSELMLDGTLGEMTPTQREKMSILHESAVSLSRLITDLLDIRKIELGKLKLEKSEVEVSDIVKSSINGMLPLAEAKNIQLSHTSEYGDVKLYCDSKRIQQVMNNLLTNAIKFTTNDAGKIEVFVQKISVDTGNVQVVFNVRDNGLGIPKEKQKGLFKKFYQVDTSLTRNIGGTGLGLAISKGIIEAHNGEIWVESEGIEGKGSTFRFSLLSCSLGNDHIPVNGIGVATARGVKEGGSN